MGNLYRSFAQCVAAKAVVEACLESNRQGNVWVPINR